jgi:phosphatidylglycerol:prolipoprotein diacylglycerol transferase
MGRLYQSFYGSKSKVEVGATGSPLGSKTIKDDIMAAMMQHFVWNVDPVIFSLGPFHPRWYGVFFALGFFLGYEILAQFYRREGRSLENLPDLSLYLVLGTIIGARLGHVFLYEPAYFLAHPWQIPMVWQGGLASHGGFAGVMIALYLYLKKHPEMTFIASLLAAAMIRIGNFFNSEIIGTPSNLPWAVVFARVDDIPRHPAMLYEALAYLLVFSALYVAYWKTKMIQRLGRTLGTSLAACFFARFMIEFVKENQVPFEKQMLLNMGQLLSIPFIAAGLYLIYRSGRKSRSPGRP